MLRSRHILVLLWVMLVGCLTSCGGGGEYDTSSPQKALDAMHQMIRDGRPELLGNLVHIEAREITYSDGVTEASAIDNVREKIGQMLGQLYRVANKLRERFPNEVQKELDAAGESAERRGGGWEEVTRFLTDPFGLMDEQKQRVSVEDLGDGTAAILIDGEPVMGFGLNMREITGEGWKVDLPIEYLQRYRPNTREEWSVLASMILSIEKALTAFEEELDRGELRDLAEASRRAGRLLGERVAVQAIIYSSMKEQDRKSEEATKPQSDEGNSTVRKDSE